METHAKVVVIGGGVVGCSILFHLAKFGLKDCILLERKELTSGSSWHAAGNVHVISSDPNISRLMAYTINLYKEIEKTSGHSTGFKPSGGFYLASNDIWHDYLKRERSKARYMGLDQEFISLEDVVKKNPIINPKHYIAALWDPIDGEVDPSGVTYAYAKSAKVHGAKYYTNTPVLETNQKKDGTWEVITEKGNINAEIVISDSDIIFSASSSIFSFDLYNGYLNWKEDIGSKNTPIIDGNNVFLISDNGYFVNIDRNSGKIIWSTNILKILKKRKRVTQITGFIMGSGKIYATTLNGYLIVCSAVSGNIEYFKKIGNQITAAPIINDGSLYILTEN